MASISISGSPSTTNNSITINYTTSGISNITNVQLSKDGGSNYINPMSFSNTSATFNVGDWGNGTYSNCVLKVTYTDTSGGDSGGSGGTVDTNLSATILNMQYASSHEAIPNIPNADWKNAPRLSDKGATLPVQNCSDCASGTHSGAYNAGSLWSAFGQWATIYKVADTSLVENVGVEITDFKMWRYNTTTNQWILVNEGFEHGAFYLEDFWDDGNAPLPNNKVLSNDKKTYKCLMNSATAGRCFHPFSPQINWADVGFSNNTNPCYVVSQMKARLIVWDSNGSDNRASANLCANVGGDYWIYKGATYDNQWRHNGDFAIGYFKKLTNDWQYIYATTCPSSWDKGFPCDSITNNGSTGGSGSTGGDTVSNESSWANGVPYTFNWVDGEYVSNTNGEFKVYDSDSRTPKLYCYGASTIEIISDSRNQYNAWYTSDGTFIKSFSIPGTIAVPSNAHYFAVTSSGANKSSVTITPHS